MGSFGFMGMYQRGMFQLFDIHQKGFLYLNHLNIPDSVQNFR